MISFLREKLENKWPSKRTWVLTFLVFAFALSITLSGFTNSVSTVSFNKDQDLAQSTGAVTANSKVENMFPLSVKVDKFSAFTEIDVNISVDNKTYAVSTTAKSVENILQEHNVKLGKYDIVSPKKTTKVQEGATISVQRVVAKKSVTTQPLPYKTEIVYTTSLKEGKSKITQKGKDGVQEVTTTNFYVEGVLDKSKTKSTSKIITPAVNQVKKVGVSASSGAGASSGSSSGSKLPTISPLNYGPLKNGLPKNATLYKKNAVATAYTASEGARTSTGRVPQVGYVAVNPKKIPYGTKLFIVSADGKYIYGYALAADTGGALMSGAADVDLYFNSHNQCIQFGRRPVHIYIVK